ncbi:DUF6192 family protein [Streptomyces sp. NPDC056007]|uniref:DUF6192 family protein n=1 Tax=Streptomyces sp. NPDC056007 TaxID=3345678 RepID=UPI0035DF1C55
MRAPHGGPAGRTVLTAPRHVAKVKVTLDWIERAVDTGKVGMDDELVAYEIEPSWHVLHRDRDQPEADRTGPQRSRHHAPPHPAVSDGERTGTPSRQARAAVRTHEPHARSSNPHLHRARVPRGPVHCLVVPSLLANMLRSSRCRIRGAPRNRWTALPSAQDRGMRSVPWDWHAYGEGAGWVPRGMRRRVTKSPAASWGMWSWPGRSPDPSLLPRPAGTSPRIFKIPPAGRWPLAAGR